MRGSPAKKDADQQDDGGAGRSDHDCFEPLDPTEQLDEALLRHSRQSVQFSLDRDNGGLAHQSASAIVKSPAATCRCISA